MYTRDRSPLDTIHLPLLLRDLFILASVFLAAKPMRERPVICDLENMFFDDEAFRQLLSIAAILRAKYDWHDSVPPRPEWDPKDLSIMDCGTLRNGGKSVPLTHRKACNKIIHATSHRFGAATPPTMELTGEHYGQQWEAYLRLDEFLEVSCLLAREKN